MNEVAKRIVDGPRRSTNLTLPETLVERACSLGVNLSAAAERGIAEAVARAADADFADRHRPAMEAWNAWISAHGSQLDSFRAF